MAWTTPATATVGQIYTAAFYNAQTRDNLSYLHGDAGTISLIATLDVAYTGPPAIQTRTPFSTRSIENYLLAGDAVPVHRVFGSGEHDWGLGGSSPLDTWLYRSAAGQLALGRISGATVYIGDNGSGFPAIFLGSSLADYFYLPAAGRISSAGAVEGRGALITKVKAGAPVDADVSGGALDGAIIVDSTNNKIWARVGGVWKGVGIA